MVGQERLGSEVKAVAVCGPDVSEIVVPALDRKDQVLDVVPIDVEDARIEAHAPALEVALGAELVIPDIVRVVSRGCRRRASGWWWIVNATHSIALGCREVPEIVFSLPVREREFRRELRFMSG